MVMNREMAKVGRNELLKHVRTYGPLTLAGYFLFLPTGECRNLTWKWISPQWHRDRLHVSFSVDSYVMKSPIPFLQLRGGKIWRKRSCCGAVWTSLKMSMQLWIGIKVLLDNMSTIHVCSPFQIPRNLNRPRNDRKKRGWCIPISFLISFWGLFPSCGSTCQAVAVEFGSDTQQNKVCLVLQDKIT